MSFECGQKVRVKEGTKDVDFDNLDPSGFTGKVFLMEGKQIVVKFDVETLAKMPSWYVSECKRRGLEIDEYSYSQDELESVG